MDPALDFWPALGITLPVTLLVAQVVVGWIAHPLIRREQPWVIPVVGDLMKTVPKFISALRKEKR